METPGRDVSHSAQLPRNGCLPTRTQKGARGVHLMASLGSKACQRLWACWKTEWLAMLFPYKPELVFDRIPPSTFWKNELLSTRNLQRAWSNPANRHERSAAAERGATFQWATCYPSSSRPVGCKWDVLWLLPFSGRLKRRVGFAFREGSLPFSTSHIFGGICGLCWRKVAGSSVCFLREARLLKGRARRCESEF